MKTTLLVLLSVLTITKLCAQKGFQFQDAGKHNIRVSYLDSTYKSAIHSDSTKAVFKDNEEVAKAYNTLLQDLGNFLYKNGFLWEQTVRGFNRIYFNKDGSIDYFIYTFRSELTAEQLSKFNTLLNEFIQDYKFPLSADEKFAQCSPVTYVPKEKK